MDLALATGHGPSPLANLECRGPPVRLEDVVAIGFRNADESAKAGTQPLPARLRTIDLDGVRQAGDGPAVRKAIGWLTADGTSGYEVHLDADVPVTPAGPRQSRRPLGQETPPQWSRTPAVKRLAGPMQ
jgi:arginase